MKNTSRISEVGEDFFDDMFSENEVNSKKEEVLEEEVSVQKDEIVGGITAIPVVDESFFDDNTDDTPQSKEEISDNSEQLSQESLFSAQIEYYKKQGVLPDDFEMPEGVELNEDSFGEVLEYGIENMKANLESEIRTEFTSKLGDNLMSFLENGGDYSKFAELLKENVEIQKADISTEKGQKEIVRKYYENLGWSEYRIDKTIDRLINDDDLQEEALNFKASLDESHAKKEAELVKQQEVLNKKQIALEQKQQAVFYESLKTTGMSKQDADSYFKFVYEPAYTIKDTTLTLKEVKLLEIEKNPKELTELVMFLANKEEYLKRKAIEINNPIVDTKFKTIVKNQQSVGNKKSDIREPEKATALRPFKIQF